jgi:hypothetical protein
VTRVTRAQVPQHHTVGFQASNGSMEAKIMSISSSVPEPGVLRRVACDTHRTTSTQRHSLPTRRIGQNGTRERSKQFTILRSTTLNTSLLSHSVFPTHTLQAGGRGFESLKLHQTGDKLEKPSQKCGGFSVSYSEVTAIARFNSLFRTAVVPTGNTYRRYPQAPLFIQMVGVRVLRCRSMPYLVI